MSNYIYFLKNIFQSYIGNVLNKSDTYVERARLDDTLQFVAKRGWSQDAEPFHTALVRHLGKILEVDYVLIDKLIDNSEEAETIAIYGKGEILPNVRYSLKETPCNNVMNGNPCCYSCNVQQFFPRDHLLTDMDVEAYVGLPLWNSSDEVIGLIAIMHSKPIKNADFLERLLKLVASRTAAELERERAEQVLKASEQEQRRLLESISDVIVRYDTQCRRTYTNPVHNKIMAKPVAIGTTPIEDWGIPNGIESAKAYQAELEKILESGEVNEWELNWDDADGNAVCYLVRGVPEFDKDGKIISVLVIGRDITARKRLELATIAREKEFRALVDNSPDFVTRFDAECRRTHVNPTLTAVLDVEYLLGKTPSESHPGNDQIKEYEAHVRRVLESGKESQYMLNFTGKDEHRYCLDIRIVPELNDSGKIVGALAIGRDISDRLLLEEELRRQASHDILTGLPNRWMFGTRLREEIAKAERYGNIVAILFIDLDRFKEVNDTLGHDIGDQLLLEVAHRIQACMRKTDTLARIGGDEFIAILPGIKDVSYLGSLAQNIIDSVSKSFTLDGNLTYISASIGIASYPRDADNAEMLVSCADQAMYMAKQQGRSSFRFFMALMQKQAENRLHLINDLRSAMSQQQCMVYYQPIIETDTGRVDKAEALLRWQHPERGIVSPDQFIPLAEETGMIHELGDWVFREAVNTVKRWHELDNDPTYQMSINLSPRQFLRGSIIDSWLEYLKETNVSAKCIVIEITEGLLLDDQPNVLDKLEQLREAGIQVALDDFGTGYSAMAYLKKFNIDYLKIDRSFIHDLTIDENDRAIAETIVVMAKRLGLKTIAEGVETVAQSKILSAVGCEYVQGYHYAKPLPKRDFLEYVANTRYKCV